MGNGRSSEYRVQTSWPPLGSKIRVPNSSLRGAHALLSPFALAPLIAGDDSDERSTTWTKRADKTPHVKAFAIPPNVPAEVVSSQQYGFQSVPIVSSGLPVLRLVHISPSNHT